MKLLLLLTFLSPFCLSALSENVPANISTSVNSESSTVTNSSAVAKDIATNSTSQNSTKASAQLDVTSNTTTITSKNITAAQTTVTVKLTQPASTKHSPTESGLHNKTPTVPVTGPPSASVTVTSKASVFQAAASRFSAGSFIGGIVLALGLVAIGYIGCRTYHTKRGIQYRTIDEHDAII